MIRLLLLLLLVPPVRLHTSWNGLAGGTLDTNAARAILFTPLKVTDDKGAVYAVTRFRFSYRQNSAYQDSSGNIVHNTQLFSREYFNTTLVDSTWSRIISFELQSGEAFVIDNIVVKDAKGAKLLAPNLELDVR
jgi:hypothetical protein